MEIQRHGWLERLAVMEMIEEEYLRIAPGMIQRA